MPYSRPSRVRDLFEESSFTNLNKRPWVQRKVWISCTLWFFLFCFIFTKNAHGNMILENSSSRLQIYFWPTSSKERTLLESREHKTVFNFTFYLVVFQYERTDVFFFYYATSEKRYIELISWVQPQSARDPQLNLSFLKLTFWNQIYFY